MKPLLCLAIAACLSQPAAARPNNTWNTVAREARQSVLLLLRDPGSANFRDVQDYILQYGDVHIACGLVNAKNGFGGYVGFKRFISEGPLEKTYLEGLGGITEADFAEAWKLCK
jgi:hypothetical protein